MRRFDTYVGIDLGGSRGKTTAVASLRHDPTSSKALVVEAASRHTDRNQVWTDDILLSYVAAQPTPILGINAPLSVPACMRCQLPVCPSAAKCVEPAVVWLRTEGAAMEAAALQSKDRIAAIPHSNGFTSAGSDAVADRPRSRLAPYTHRCTEVSLHYQRDLLPRESLGQTVGPLAARGVHLRKVLAGAGFEPGKNLLEVAPRATVKALFGEAKARGYKRDADPWVTRAGIVEGLHNTLSFAPESRMSREEVLRNDHCFDALLSAYSAFLWARDEWPDPVGEPWHSDGFIWAPPPKET